MTEREFQDALESLLQAAGYLDEDADVSDFEDEVEPFQNCRVRTYQDVGMLTRNHGLVVRMGDGSEFQVTIVQSA